jgi:glycosyltransferase involved in cell wall biosynthesis
MLSWEYPPHVIGGLGQHVAALAPALTNLGVDIHLITPRHDVGESIETVNGGLTVHRVAPAHREPRDIVTHAHEANTWITDYAVSLVRDHEAFDLVHAHDWLVAPSAVFFKHQYKWPLVATLHATERGRRGGEVNNPLSVAIDRIEWQLLYEAWHVIVTSQYMADQVKAFFQVPLDKIGIIPNGVDWLTYQRFDGEDLAVFRRRFADDGERLVFHVGRLVYEKGAHTLVAAARNILSEFPNVRFVIAGRGPMHVELLEMAASFGVSDHFNFVGYISDDDRDRLYRVADVTVIPSLYEPFGIVALEAMAAGAPVVASDAGGLGEIVRGRETGITHPPGDPESLAQSVRYMLRHPEQARTWQENGLAQIHRVFNWAHVARETVKVFEQVVEKRKQVDW